MSKKKTKKKKVELPKPFPEEPEEAVDPILNEIETLFDDIKEGGILTAEYEEQREVTASNLIIAYYLNKLDKKIHKLIQLISKKGKK